MDAPGPNAGPTLQARGHQTGGTGVADRASRPDARPATTLSTCSGVQAVAEFDPTRPHPARDQACWLGNHKDSFAADRAAAAQIAEIAPWIVAAARAERAFRIRAVTHLARAGIDQFLDLARPIAALLVGVLQSVRDDNDASEIVAGLRNALPSGSHIVISHAVDLPDRLGQARAAATLQAARLRAMPFRS
jgi:hypothetical protein